MSSTEWSQGYVTDIPYIEGFTRELSPTWLNYVAAISGCVPRDVSGEFNFMELGCGLGMSTAVLAGCFPRAQFYGVDFNPAHIDLARRNASQWGINNAQFIERSFEDLMDLDLPDFDFITLHGVYVWIDPESQKAIQRFIKTKLKPGGIVYISYNCMPGWTTDAPIRKWLFEFAGFIPGDSLARVSQAINTLQKANELNAGYFKVVSNSIKPISEIIKQKPNYIAHEYMNEHWELPYSVDVADQMESAKLNFAGSATIIENMFDLTMPREAVQYIESLPSGRLRQLASDFFTFRRFRRDVFVRGHGRLSREAMLKQIRAQVVGAVKNISSFTDQIKLPQGEISVKDPALPILREVLEKGAQTIGAIEAQVSQKLQKRSQTERILSLMIAADRAGPFSQTFEAPKLPDRITKARWRHPVNEVIAQSSLTASKSQYLINPILGNAWIIEPVCAAVVSLLDGKEKNIAELVQLTGQKLRAHGIVVQAPSPAKVEGKAVAEGGGADVGGSSSQEDNIKILTDLVNQALKNVIPLMDRIGLLELS